MSAELRHMEIVEAISAVAARVMMVALPVSATFSLTFDTARDALKQDVIEVLKLRDYPPIYTDQHAHWSDLLKQADERTRLIFIALVLGIYE